MNEKNYIYLTKALTYCELCYLEDALKNFSPAYLENERDQLALTALRQKVTFARGWAHHYGKLTGNSPLKHGAISGTISTRRAAHE